MTFKIYLKSSRECPSFWRQRISSFRTSAGSDVFLASKISKSLKRPGKQENIQSNKVYGGFFLKAVWRKCMYVNASQHSKRNHHINIHNKNVGGEVFILNVLLCFQYWVWFYRCPLWFYPCPWNNSKHTHNDTVTMKVIAQHQITVRSLQSRIMYNTVTYTLILKLYPTPPSGEG